jgi:hypothetical protein
MDLEKNLKTFQITLIANSLKQKLIILQKIMNIHRIYRHQTIQIFPHHQNLVIRHLNLKTVPNHPKSYHRTPAAIIICQI